MEKINIAAFLNLSAVFEEDELFISDSEKIFSAIAKYLF